MGMFDWFWRPFAPPTQTGNVAILNTPTPQPRTATGAPYINYQPTQPTPTTPPVQQVQTIQPTAQATELQSRYGTRYVGYENLVVRKPSGGFDTRAADAAIAQAQRQRETATLRASRAPVDIWRYGEGRTVQEQRAQIVQQIQAAPRDQREPLLARYRTLESQQWRQGMEAEAQIEGRPSIALQTIRAKEPTEVLQIRAEPKPAAMPTMAPIPLQSKEAFQPKAEPAKPAPSGFFDALDKLNESIYGEIASKVPGGKGTIEAVVSAAARQAAYGPVLGPIMALIPKERKPITMQFTEEMAVGTAMEPIERPATAAIMFGIGSAFGAGTRVVEAVGGTKTVSTLLAQSPKIARGLEMGAKAGKAGLIGFTAFAAGTEILLPSSKPLPRRAGGVIGQLGVGIGGYTAAYRSPEYLTAGTRWLTRSVPEVPLWRAGSAQELKPGVRILDVRPEIDLTKIEAKPIGTVDAIPRVNIEEARAVTEAQDIRLLVNVARRSGFSKMIGGQYYTGAERAGIEAGMTLFPEMSFPKPVVSEVVLPKVISIKTPAQRAVSIAKLSYPFVRQTPIMDAITEPRSVSKQSDYITTILGTGAAVGTKAIGRLRIDTAIVPESVVRPVKKEKTTLIPRLTFRPVIPEIPYAPPEVPVIPETPYAPPEVPVIKVPKEIGGSVLGFLAGAGLGGGGGGGGPQPRSVYSWVVRNPVPRLRDILGGGKKKRGRRRRHRR